MGQIDNAAGLKVQTQAQAEVLFHALACQEAVQVVPETRLWLEAHLQPPEALFSEPQTPLDVAGDRNHVWLQWGDR